MDQSQKTTVKSERDLPHLAVTLGDPAGIGTEVILKALADPEVTQNCRVTVIGSESELLKPTPNCARNFFILTSMDS
jgi:4-hydroxythreonine-4-phosphate dehydrogenase